ncbi:MAG: 5'/3'-nucleotidase SurE [Christensenellales bacterium]|jgi:5'-nucleotidase
MKILVSNDDGIHAAGILALVRALAVKHEVYVCAPDGERSAASHSLTLFSPLFARKTQVDGALLAYAVSGTPVDSVKLGISEFGLPDAVFAGVNNGLNAGEDILYSGTVSAACEGALIGLPSVAVSAAPGDEEACEAACAYAVELADYIERQATRTAVVYNLNVPTLLPGVQRRCQAARVGLRGMVVKYDKRTDLRGRDYYWAPCGEGAISGALPGTDLYWMAEGHATVTPLRFDFTDEPLLEKLSEALKRNAGEIGSGR